MIKFLLINGANPHIEDASGEDCCDKGRLVRRYDKISIFFNDDCIKNKELRQKYDAIKRKTIKKSGSNI
jgi:hypothetical protein